MASPKQSSKVLVVVAQHYNPRELWPALKILQAGGIQVDIVSTGYIISNEEDASEAHKISLTVDDIHGFKGKDYAGLMVISGNPKDTEKYWKDTHVQRLIIEINNLNRPLAGICAAVPALAPAVKGKKVSYFPLIKSREILTMAGAILQEVGLTMDANLITAENEWMTEEWVEAFRDMVLGIPHKIRKLTPSGHTPAKIPRMPVPLIGQGKIT